MRDLLSTGLFLVALGLGEGALGVRAPQLAAFLSLAALLPVMADLAIGVRWRAWRGAGLGLAALGSTVFWFATPDAATRGFALALAFACWALAQAERPTERAGIAATLALAGLGTAVFDAVRDRLTLWPALVAVSSHTSAVLARIFASRDTLGPTYAGTWLFVGLAAIGVARLCLVPRRRGGAAGAAVLLALAVGASTARLHALEPALAGAAAPGPAPAWRLLLFALLLVPLALFLRTHRLPLGPAGTPGARPRTPWYAAAALLIGVGLLSWCTRTPSRPVRVLLDSRGAFAMQPLAWGQYGAQASQGASLASLPALLDARGFVCTVHDSSLDPALLEQHDVLMVMNPTHVLAPSEHRAVWDFVRGGGGLLVLGDHTNIMEIEGPLDSLLAPVGVRVNFDSAIPLVDRWSWYGCMRRHPHPATRGVRDETEVKISVGASLAVPAGALPLFTGRDAFADAGNRGNKQGAYLGNMRWDPGEPLGDLVLAAEVPYGRGKVIVFGDTSPFQRNSVTWSESFVTRVLTYLGTPGHRLLAWPLRAGGAALATAGGIGLALLAPASLPVLALAAAASAAWLAGVERTATVDLPRTPWRADVAWIDHAHGNRIDVHAGLPISIGGLASHLWRQGYLPLARRDRHAEVLPPARLFVSIAPALPFALDERRALRRFVEEGGCSSLPPATRNAVVRKHCSPTSATSSDGRRSAPRTRRTATCRTSG